MSTQTANDDYGMPALIQSLDDLTFGLGGDLQRGEAYTLTSGTLLRLLAGPIIYLDTSYDVPCKALTKPKMLVPGSFRNFHHAAHAPGCPFAKPAAAGPREAKL
ncbi:hypothetical protein C8F04DRAFT_1260473 [Mycena alexandri]|uniref:Uncharacterized protein n=1 Tax=Mycena alexandri TaxID=1745969 RepID=A0AAD6SV26_9AGAR|nr:hypothetical protein C8F04DRAFT_1260473 [Mycena alexandri]